MPGQRSATLRAALRAIESAAAHDPSPEIVVLPALADFLSIPTNDAEPLAGPTVAAFSAAAREFGVYVAFGMTARLDTGRAAVGVLVDLDGDMILAQPQVDLPSGARQVLTAGTGLRVCATLLGPAALLVCDDLLSETNWSAVMSAGAKIVLGCASWPASNRTARTAVAEFTRRAGVWTLMADTSIDDGARGTAGATCIIGPDGCVVDRAAPNGTHVCALRTSRVTGATPGGKSPSRHDGGK